MPQSKTLDQIPKGRFVHVIDIVGEDAITRRLNDLGLREGVQVQVVRKAPLGDPTVFELCGYQLCLRRSESERVRVTLDADQERDRGRGSDRDRDREAAPGNTGTNPA